MGWCGRVSVARSSEVLADGGAVFLRATLRMPIGAALRGRLAVLVLELLVALVVRMVLDLQVLLLLL